MVNTMTVKPQAAANSCHFWHLGKHADGQDCSISLSTAMLFSLARAQLLPGTSDLPTASGDLQDHPDYLRFLVQGVLRCLEHYLPLQPQT